MGVSKDAAGIIIPKTLQEEEQPKEWIEAEKLWPQPTPKALDTQVGGGHYKDYAIQPTVYCQVNKLNWCESNVVKYVTRWRDKNGLVDLQKAKHYIDLLIEIEEVE